MKLGRQHTPSVTPLDASGLTIIELVITMTLTLMFSGLVLSFFLDLWGSTATLQNDSETFVVREDAGDSLRDIFNSAAGLISQNGIPDLNTNNPDPAIAAGTYWLPIHAIPTPTTMPASGTTPVLYFESPSTDSSKNFIMNGTQPYKDNFVLYLDASTKKLMMRSLANPSATGNRTVTTCPPASATASCPADRTIATDVSSVNKRYFSRSGNTLDWTSITDPLTGDYIGPDFPSVEVLELTLNLYRKSVLHGHTDTTNATIIRIAFRNG